MRRRAINKLDENHTRICQTLRKLGVDVIEILHPVDLVVCDGKGFAGFCELKPEGRGTYTRMQLKFLSETKTPITIAKTAQDVLDFLKRREGLSQRQKDALAAFLLKSEGNKWNSEAVERILNI